MPYSDPYSEPHYAVIKDGVVITRHESSALTEQAFLFEVKQNDFLELTIQNVRGIKLLANAVIELSKTKAKELVA